LKDFEDSFKEKAPTQFVRGGFIGVNQNLYSQNVVNTSEIYEKGQVYEINMNQSNYMENISSNQNINNFIYNNQNINQYSTMPHNIPYNISTQIQGNVSMQNPLSIKTDSQQMTPEKNKQEIDKKNLKGRNLIHEIIADNEIAMNITGKDYEKNSNLYLCKISFISKKIIRL